jgi:hypothetical protein
MRTFVALTAALCFIGAPALAQKARPQIFLLHPGAEPADSEAIVIPAGSSMRLASFERESEINAAFQGRFTLSGAYEIGGYGEDSIATIRPDKKSRDALPYWRDRGGPHEIYLTNAWAFAVAVAPGAQLQKLKAGKVDLVRGRVTIVADDYQASIECDTAGFSARFVSVVRRPVQIAAIPQREEGC